MGLFEFEAWKREQQPSLSVDLRGFEPLKQAVLSYAADNW